MSTLTFILALAVTIRIACWGAKADRAQWAGRQIVYFGMAFGLALIVGGAWGLVLKPSVEGVVLLAGIDLLLLANKRSPFRGGK